MNCLSILTEIQIDHKYTGSFLDSQFDSIGLYVYPYASASLDYCSSVVSFELGKYKSVNFIIFQYLWLFQVLFISM